MPAKEFLLDDSITVKIFKRKGSRNLRLTISPNGVVRVTIPAWAPYRSGFEFAKSRHNWIIKNVSRPAQLVNDQPIGKAHRLSLKPIPSATKVTSRLSDSVIVVKYPESLRPSDFDVQKVAERASIKALRVQAEKLLPQRLSSLARVHGFEYSSVSIKRLKGRWGSCDQHKRIVLNLYLMQVPWELIEYVLLHELVHTNVLKHGPPFWTMMESVLPETKKRRKLLKNYQPILDSPV